MQKRAPQKGKGQTYEFHVQCSDEESCKRVRFSMETGMVFVSNQDTAKRIWNMGVPTKPTKHFLKCDHPVSDDAYKQARRNRPLSSEVDCTGCGTTLTIVPGESSGHKVMAIVDFDHYDDYPKGGQKVRIIVEGEDCEPILSEARKVEMKKLSR
ncbi:MAG: hypothetical protein KGH59_04145 [Candidatus Micrarchaeota archaeon]|nr:hypothetical protein [Candidatus Micrarchaeota archaeon]